MGDPAARRRDDFDSGFPLEPPIAINRYHGAAVSRDGWVFSSVMASSIAPSYADVPARFRESPDATLLVQGATPNGEPIIASANPALCALCGFAPGELVGAPLRVLDGPDGRGTVTAAFRRALTGGRGLRTHALGYRRDRSAIHADWSIWPERDAAGVSQQWIAVARPRERTRAGDLDSHRERDRLADLGRLARGAAHDLNNLLTVAIANTELALQELPPTAAARPLLEPALDASRLAAQLGDQLLRYAGGARPATEALDLSALIREMTPLLDVVGARRAPLELALAASLPTVQATRAELAQVVLNLVSNAFEAVDETQGPGRVLVATGASSPSRVYLEVRDDGPGFDTATRDRVLAPFFSTRSRGRGLGLPTAVEIVERHGGCIEIASQPGRGARFRASLPASAERAGVSVTPAP